MKIVLIVDNPIRDLPASVLVALTLVESGFTVRLVPFDNAGQGTFAANPDYVLVNYARMINETYLWRLQNAGIPIGVLDTEGGVYAKGEPGETAPIVVKTFPYSPSVRNNLSDYFIWGRNLFDYLSVSGHFPSSILRLTGTPRTDVFHPDYSPLVRDRSIILINTSFTLANPKFRSAEAEARDLIEKFNFNADSVMEALDAQRRLLPEFIEMSKNLGKRFPNERFVLRPHPFESGEPYIKGLNGVPNVEMRGDGSIDSWLYRSKALIHFECSTALEACLIDVPTFSIKKNAKFREVEIISEITDYCEDEVELTERLEAVLRGAYKPTLSLAQRRERMIENIYFRFDGKAHLRVRDAIAATLSKQPKAKASVKMFWRTFYFFRNLVRRLAGRAIVRKPKTFTLDDVEVLIRRFRGATNKVGERAEAVQKPFAVEIKSR